MDTKIKDAFYDPKQGYISANKLAKKLNIPLKEAKAIVKKQETDQIFHNKPIKKSNYFPIVSNPRSYQADLLFLDKYARANGGVKALFNIINTTTRMAYTYPIKTKMQEEIANAFEDFVARIKGKISTITTDNGLEFKNKEFKKITDEFNIRHYFTDPNEKRNTSRVERYNGTIRNLIYKYLLTNDTLKYIDVLDDLVYNYNNTPHNSLFSKSPATIDDDTVVKIMLREKEMFDEVDTQNNKFSVGDKVRSLNKRNLFEKGRATYSKTIKTITEKMGNSWILDNDKTKRYKYYELVKLGDVETKPVKEDEQKPVKQYNQQVKEVDKERKVEKELRKIKYKIDTDKLIPQRSKREPKTSAKALEYIASRK